MAKYTTELGTLIKQGFNPGLMDYPIFDEAYRETLNQKIINHFRYCELGSETPGRFKHYLNSMMDEIMPYYNKLYRTELLEFNPLYNVDYTETSKKTTAGESDTTTERNANTTNDNTQTRNLTDLLNADGTRNNTQTINTSVDNENTENLFMVKSDTPGGLISVGDIKTSTWASEAKQEENTRGDITLNTGTVADDEDTTMDETRTATGTLIDDGSGTLAETGAVGTVINNVDDYIKTVQGNIGGKNFSEMIQDFRSTILNIDMKIIKDLKILFMGVY
jgi:hypothetical protein